jgi:hypothetical protein
MFNITGILKLKTDEQKVSDRFRKRDFVLTDTSSQYPQHITFQLVQDRCSLIDNIPVGAEIRVFFNLRGREWTPKDGGPVKYFNTIEAWKIEPVSAGGQNPATQNFQSAPVPDVTTFTGGGGSDDLPF